MPPSRKRAKTTATTTRVTRSMASSRNTQQAEDPDCSSKNVVAASSGLLGTSPIENAPLDILFEVFMCLRPKDLIALTRTSKTFRAFLMSRKSARFWKAARVRYARGAPECPPHISEPHYAILLFTSDCTKCGRLDVEETFWVFFARYCTYCRGTELVPLSAIRDLLVEVEEKADCTGEYLIHVNISQPSMVYSWMTERHPHYHRPEVDQFKASWKRCKTGEARKRLVEGRIAALEGREQETRAIKLWGTAEDQKRAVRRVTLREERKNVILTWLRAQGWGDELDKAVKASRIDMLYNLPVFRPPRPLTQSDWAGGIRVTLINTMDAIRAKRLRQERFELLIERLKVLHRAITRYERSLGHRNAASDLRAEFADLALAPGFRQLMESPLSKRIATEDYVPLLDTIPVLQAEWYQARQREFEALASKHAAVNVSEEVEAPLELAILSFRCVDCKREGMRWPNVLAHRCGRGPYYDRSQDTLYCQALESVCHQLKISGPWRPSCPSFVAVVASGDIEAMIRASGHDPSTATYEQMQDCGKRFYCKICSVPSIGYLQAYDWKGTSSHLFPRCDIHNIGFGPSGSVKANKWTILDTKHTTSVIAADAALQAKGDVPDAVFGCTRCPYRSRGFPSSHCTSMHGSPYPRIGEDFYLHPETGTARHPIIIYPEDARRDRIAAKDVDSGRGLFSAALFA